ncbi:hypothetical protein MKZ38_001348 [Zalerion maritima]|uniref:Uncharacterized protein n=1 Tax=Zalerion maritima TaxID=339359 RepID=A0AAD5RXY0_9PEZI|nr:hypothetical protein MKZ38_001348 [Zalerion maritima]
MVLSGPCFYFPLSATPLAGLKWQESPGSPLLRVRFHMARCEAYRIPVFPTLLRTRIYFSTMVDLVGSAARTGGDEYGGQYTLRIARFLSVINLEPLRAYASTLREHRPCSVSDKFSVGNFNLTNSGPYESAAELYADYLLALDSILSAGDRQAATGQKELLEAFRSLATTFQPPEVEGHSTRGPRAMGGTGLAANSNNRCSRFSTRRILMFGEEAFADNAFDDSSDSEDDGDGDEDEDGEDKQHPALPAIQSHHDLVTRLMHHVKAKSESAPQPYHLRYRSRELPRDGVVVQKQRMGLGSRVEPPFRALKRFIPDETSTFCGLFSEALWKSCSRFSNPITGDHPLSRPVIAVRLVVASSIFTIAAQPSHTTHDVLSIGLHPTVTYDILPPGQSRSRVSSRAPKAELEQTGRPVMTPSSWGSTSKADIIRRVAVA